jgi:hypothetical protein
VAEDNQRLRTALSAPPGVAIFLRFPESLILAALSGFMCMGLSAWQIPLLLFFFTFLNG